MPLSNDYKACRVYDLHPQNRRLGPFIVTQSVIEADDPLQQERLFLLRRDGVWVDLLAPALHEPAGHCAICFGTLGEVINLLQSLPPKARIERSQPPAGQAAEWQRQMDDAGGPLAFIEARVQHWRASGAAKPA